MGWQDILKSYDLDEFIIIKNKKGSKKEKGADEFKVNIPGGEITVTRTARIKQLKEDFKNWETTCSNLSMDDIGIVAEKGRKNLLEFVLSHVEQSVQRPKQEPKDGAMDILKDVSEVIKKDDIYTNVELQSVQDFIELLEEVKENSRTNPKNIIFTEQISRTRKRPVRGHYRTPWYEKKTGKKAVDSDWFDYNVSFDRNDNSSTAEPPLWQALFNGQPDLIEKATITGLEKGLLTILMEFEEEMKNQPVSDIPVIGKEGREAVLQIQGVTQGMQAILTKQESYHSMSEPFKRLWLNVTNVRKQLNVMEFSIDEKDEQAVNAILKLVPYLRTRATRNYEGMKIVKITTGLLRSIIRKMDINIDTFAHGGYKGIFLHRPWTTKVQQGRKKLFEAEYRKAKKDGNLPPWARREEEEDGVKKSWESILKIMPQRIEPMKNPAAGLHMPTIFSKEKQAQVSRDNNETCDYCEKDVVLKCRECKQKLCYDHLNKPCVMKKSIYKKDRRVPSRKIPMKGGTITIQEMRNLIQEIKDDTTPEEEEAKNLVLVNIPITYEDGQQELKTGLFNYDAAKEFFGASQLQKLLETAKGLMGAHFVDKEDLIGAPFSYEKMNVLQLFRDEELMNEDVKEWGMDENP